MKLNEFKNKLKEIEQLNFVLQDGSKVPAHFHITEIGEVNKRYVDCGGTFRTESKISFQLWVAEDTDHRLTPERLLEIIRIGEDQLAITNAEIEMEYQQDTIGKFGVIWENNAFVLSNLQTDCLAKDRCGIPTEKPKIKLTDLTESTASTCTPGSGCC